MPFVHAENIVEVLGKTTGFMEINSIFWEVMWDIAGKRTT
jgi:hypothetical protein